MGAEDQGRCPATLDLVDRRSDEDRVRRRRSAWPFQAPCNNKNCLELIDSIELGENDHVVAPLCAWCASSAHERELAAAKAARRPRRPQQQELFGANTDER